MAHVQLILASKSPGRLTTLRNAGVEPIVLVSEVDEDAVVDSLRAKRHPFTPKPAEIVGELARAKAMAIAGRCLTELEQDNQADDLQQCLVLGCDSMLEINGRMAGKPHTPEVAVERIREMRGMAGTLWTGHAVVPLHRDSERWIMETPLVESASTVVHFGQISEEEIAAYVATGEPLKVAGSFTIDGLGGPFVEGVTGDPHSVVGVSLPLLRRLVSRAGVFWPDLWSPK